MGVVQVEYFVGDEVVVVVICDQVDVYGGYYYLQCVDCFVVCKCNGGKGRCVKNGDDQLDQVLFDEVYVGFFEFWLK